ncbi:MAG: triphosphoribosyl-dephospho-CoA synthase MdcB [Herminiimonas sp.]|nr:triphosphoribosyl-dephospho-CoA synthase MdcB [Herminiimonas sp.]
MRQLSSCQPDSLPGTVARDAVRSLYGELRLYPKPGLVSMVDNGSHHDMTASTFMRSIVSLRWYFREITRAGIDGAGFDRLLHLGLQAERRMLAATGGVNTHRGAIFCLGLLCAAIGRASPGPARPSEQAIRTALLAGWGADLAVHRSARVPDAHGTRVATAHAVGGAREEAAAGMPSVFEIGLPALRRTLRAGRGWDCACTDAFFALLAAVDDTTVYHRGGAGGAATVRAHGLHFLAIGGTADPRWRTTALVSHRLFVERRLSPGGVADLLAATCLVQRVTHGVTDTATPRRIAEPVCP